MKCCSPVNSKKNGERSAGPTIGNPSNNFLGKAVSSIPTIFAILSMSAICSFQPMALNVYPACECTRASFSADSSLANRSISSTVFMRSYTVFCGECTTALTHDICSSDTEPSWAPGCCNILANRMCSFGQLRPSAMSWCLDDHFGWRPDSRSRFW